MSGIITDIFQSLAIGILTISLFVLARPVTRLLHPTASQHITFDYKEPEAVCGCKHHHCFHDENGCWFCVNDYYGKPTGIRCACKCYTGPEPLPQVIP